MPEAPAPVPPLGDNSLEFLVFSGCYEQVLSRTASGYSNADAPAVIGALALSGRLDEAESAFRALDARGQTSAGLTQARFFLVAGLCHSGQSPRALREAVGNLRQVFAQQPAERYWACQGLALARYFEGRFRNARRFAKRALAAAVEASFPYARLLALDLLAHLSVHLGDIFAGLRSLSQAEALAQALGYQGNVATLRTAALNFDLRFSLGDVPSVIAQVEELTRHAEVSYFTRRNALIELGTVFALRGEAERARAALETARSISLPGSDSRGKVRWLIAHALCMALARGPELAQKSLEEARSAAADQLTLRVEIGFVELVFGAPSTPERRAEYQRLATASGSQRIRIALDVALGHSTLHPPRIEDAMARLLLECAAQAPRERVLEVCRAGFLGLVPWALSRPPGRRIIVTSSQVLTENQGTVRALPAPLRPALKLLFAIRGGKKTRAELLNEVWGIARFVPSRHTPTLHTAVSRLRMALGEPDWVLTLDDGYALFEGVEVLNWDARADELFSASAAPPPDDRERVLDFVRARGEVSSRDVTDSLDLSASTALRLLRRLADEGLLERRGGGRSTRYSLRSALENS